MKILAAHLARLMLIAAAAILLLDAIALAVQPGIQPFAIVVLLGIIYRATRKRWQASSAYGSARIAGLGDLLAGGFFSERGLILGRAGNTARPSKAQALRALLRPAVPSLWAIRIVHASLFGTKRADDMIRVKDHVHLATFAPAGGGKTVAVLAPNLLSYDGNCVVIDPKGELYKLTHKHRKHAFGHHIVRLDPAGLYGPGGDSFNPFDFIDPTRPDFVEVCRDLANMLVVRTGKEMDPHWCDSAENVITSFIAYICALEGNPAARNLRGVRTLIANRDYYTDAIEVMQKQSDGVLEQLGHTLSWHVDKELGSVMTHAQRFTNIFDSPLVAVATGSTSFKPERLRKGKMTIYVIIPPDRMVTWAGLQRLWLGSLMRIITRGVPTEKNPVLFMVDEAAHIGKMQVLEDAITLMRGMGIRLWLFFQSQEQLKKVFGENAGTVLDNLATQQYFAINSYETAKAVSERIGDETIVIRTEGGSDGSSSGTSTGRESSFQGGRNSGTSYNVSEIARRLLKPEEILTLPEHVAIVFHKNHYVIVCNKIRYYADRAFRRRGFVFRKWGTGRTRGLGATGLMLGLVALASALAVSVFVADLVTPNRRPNAVAAGGYPLPYQPPGDGFDQ